MPGLIIDIKQCFGITGEARGAAIDGLMVNVVAVHWLPVESADEDRLHGAVGRACVGECANAGGFQSNNAVGAGETEDALCAPQPLHDAIAEKLLDQIRAGGAYGAGLLEAPLPIVSEELACIRREVVRDGAPISGAMRAHMGGYQSIVLKDRHGDIGGAYPQCLTDECKRR